MNKRWVANEFSQSFIRDERLTNRVIDVVEKLDANPQATMPQALGSWNKTKACYRMLDNEKLTKEVLLSGHRIQTIERMKNYETVLNIQDTTHLDFSHHPNTEGLGAYCEFENKIGMLFCKEKLISFYEKTGWTHVPASISKIIAGSSIIQTMVINYHEEINNLIYKDKIF